jgi:hypothetical protein
MWKVEATRLVLRYGSMALVGLLVFFMLILMMMFGGQMQKEQNYGARSLSPEVLRFQPIVEKYAEILGMQEHVMVILAIMQQESGGRAEHPNIQGDVMQSSESKCGRRFCITDPEESIERGMTIFKTRLSGANGDVQMALQSYNFGPGFLNWMKKQGEDTYSQERAIEFSAYMYTERIPASQKHLYTCVRKDLAPQNACYGDPYYVNAVMQYLTVGTPIMAGEWAMPLHGDIRVTSPYGIRKHPITGVQSMHRGVDFACTNFVTPILSVDGGQVVGTRNNPGGYGLYVIIKHDEGLYTQYAHMSSISVTENQIVQQGQQIGVCGNTGASTGPHLHFEVRQGMESRTDFDPTPLLGL